MSTADGDVAWYERMLEDRPDLADVPWCWTVVQPLTGPVTVAEVVRRLGGDPAGIEQRAGWDFDEAAGTLHLRQAGSAVVLWQTAGDEGVRDEALRWLSDGASVHSSWWSDANGRGSLCYAAFGLVLTRLEDLGDDQPAGEQPTALDQDRAALRDDLEHRAQLAFVERRTGIRLDPAWLDQPHATVVIRTPIPDDPRPPGLFGSADPDLTAMLLGAGDATRREALWWLLDALADDQDLRGEPAVGAVLAALPQAWPTGTDLPAQLSSLRARLNRDVDASPGMSPERWRHYYRMRAAEAFAAAATGAGSYPTDAFWYAQQALPERWPAVRAELWRRARHERLSG